MKKLILIIALLVLVAPAIEAKDFEVKKFETTYVITFNEITLEEASRLEKKIKKEYSKACKINVKLREVAGTDAVFGNITYGYATSGTPDLVY